MYVPFRFIRFTLPFAMQENAVQTQGIKYAGSKKLLIPQILSLIHETGAKTVWDAFSGTTRVSQALAQNGYRTVASDISVWSEIFGTCWLLNRREASEYEALIRHLNEVPPQDGWFSENYGGDPELSFPTNSIFTAVSVSDSRRPPNSELNPNSGLNSDSRLPADSDSVLGFGSVPSAAPSRTHSAKRPFSAPPQTPLKKPFQRKNMRKLDGIRAEIDRLNLDPVSRAVALTSLMLALDQVDSTLGHFSSYLRQWSKRSFKDLRLSVPHLWKNQQENEVYRGDVFTLTPKIQADLAYFDPPYGSNNEKMPPSRVRYSAYYHFWTSVVQNDSPEVFGKALRRADSSDLRSSSIFEEFRKNEKSGRFLAVEAIQRLLAETQARWILLSYSSGGRATADELRDAIHSAGKLRKMLKIDYRKNVMANMKWTNEWLRQEESQNQEFLFLIEKN